MLERLQKIIARAGIASRRHAEELMASGLVTVNGSTVTQPGTKADESRDHIKVNGKLVHPEPERIYLLLHKPPEVVSTMSDPEGRPSLRDLLQGVSARVFPVGRLEYRASGLVFLTNDGQLANLIFKSHALQQTYLVKLKSLLTFAEIEQLARATRSRISRLKGKETPWYEVTLTESRSDALRNKLFQTGHPVEKMKRVRIANLELDRLEPGQHRALSPAEVAAFRRALSSGVALPSQAQVSVPSKAPSPIRAFSQPPRRSARSQSNRPHRGRPAATSAKRDFGKRRGQPRPHLDGPRSQPFRHERSKAGKAAKPGRETRSRETPRRKSGNRPLPKGRR